MSTSALPGSSIPLRLEVLTSLKEVVRLRAEWLTLEAAADANLPFQTWEWTVAWWKHLRANRRTVRDRLRVCVLRNQSDLVVAIVPLILTERPAIGPFRVRELQPIGADPYLTEIRTWLCRPGFEENCLASLRTHFQNSATDWDWIRWEGTSAQVGTPDQSSEVKSAFVLELGHDWEATKAQFGRNVKASLRKGHNALRRDGFTASLEMVEGPREVNCAVDELFGLRASQASTRQRDVFEFQRPRAFLSEVCSVLASRNVARVYRLRVNGAVVATRIGFQMGRSLYLYYSGWDPACARYSVMTLLLSEIIQDAITRGTLSINLSTGRDPAKLRWRPTEVLYWTRVDIAPSALARIRYQTFTSARSIASRVRGGKFLAGALMRGEKTSIPHGQPGAGSGWPERVIRFHAIVTAASPMLFSGSAQQHSRPQASSPAKAVRALSRLNHRD